MQLSKVEIEKIYDQHDQGHLPLPLAAQNLILQDPKDCRRSQCLNNSNQK
jgi:hypothetical protein